MPQFIILFSTLPGRTQGRGLIALFTKGRKSIIALVMSRVGHQKAITYAPQKNRRPNGPLPRLASSHFTTFYGTENPIKNPSRYPITKLPAFSLSSHAFSETQL